MARDLKHGSKSEKPGGKKKIEETRLNMERYRNEVKRGSGKRREVKGRRMARDQKHLSKGKTLKEENEWQKEN